jgi:hypothetical protein
LKIGRMISIRYRPAPSALRPNVNKNGLQPSAKDQKRKIFLLSYSRFTPAETLLKGRPATAYGMLDRNFPGNQCPFPLINVVPQPPPDHEPFNFPLVHTICLVTAYSESVEGLRTTLDRSPRRTIRIAINSFSSLLTAWSRVLVTISLLPKYVCR